MILPEDRLTLLSEAIHQSYKGAVMISVDREEVAPMVAVIMAETENYDVHIVYHTNDGLFIRVHHELIPSKQHD